MSPNRIVALLTPLVFAPAAGAVSAWLATHFPGVDVSQSDIQAIFIGGALIALAPAVQWLHGWQKYEAREADAEHAVELANAQAAALQATDPTAGDFGSSGDDSAFLDELADGDGLDGDAGLLAGDDGMGVRTS